MARASQATAEWLDKPPSGMPRDGFSIRTLEDLSKMVLTKPRTIIEGLLPIPGCTVLVGSQKAGKTVLAVQMGMSIAAGEALFQFYQVNEPGPVLLIEQDDPGGEAALKDTMNATPINIHGKPFRYMMSVDLVLGQGFFEQLEATIQRDGYKLVILDSYTALRGSRSGGGDIVKLEAADFGELDRIAKRNDMAIVILHHVSGGRAGMDWSDKAAGTFAIGQSTESQIFIERFRDLEVDAPERHVRARGRRTEVEMLLRFRKPTLDYEHVLSGGAAQYWPDIRMLQQHFGTQIITPKSLLTETGMSRASVHRLINRLLKTNVLRRRGTGEYILTTQL